MASEGFKNTLNPLKQRLVKLNTEALQIEFRVENGNENAKNELIRKAEAQTEKYGDTFLAINAINLEWIKYLGGIKNVLDRESESREHYTFTNNQEAGLFILMENSQEIIDRLKENIQILKGSMQTNINRGEMITVAKLPELPLQTFLGDISKYTGFIED